MSDLKLVYITCGGAEEARRIAWALIREKLAASCAVMPPSILVYEADGDLHEETEAVVMAQTSAEKAPAVAARASELNSYEKPCVLTIAVEDAHTPFNDWALRQIRSS